MKANNFLFPVFNFKVRLMISDTARHKLLVLSGQCTETTGELILQSGSFSFFNFIDIFTDEEVSQHVLGFFCKHPHPTYDNIIYYSPMHGSRPP